MIQHKMNVNMAHQTWTCAKGVSVLGLLPIGQGFWGMFVWPRRPSRRQPQLTTHSASTPAATIVSCHDTTQHNMETHGNTRKHTETHGNKSSTQQNNRGTTPPHASLLLLLCKQHLHKGINTQKAVSC